MNTDILNEESNTLTENLIRIRDAANDMRTTVEMTSENSIEEVADAVSDLKTENQELIEEYVPTDVSTEEEMDALLVKENYGKKYNYIGNEGKYLNTIYEIKRQFNNDGVVINYEGFHARRGLSSYDLSISCSIGSQLLAIITSRGRNYTISEGWTVLGNSNALGSNQHMIIAAKTATSTLETLSFSQDSTDTMFIDILELPSMAQVQFNGFSYPYLTEITKEAETGFKIYAICYVYNANYSPMRCIPNILHNLWDYYTPQVAQRHNIFEGYVEETTTFSFLDNSSGYNQQTVFADIDILNVLPNVQYNYYFDYVKVSDVLNSLQIKNQSLVDLSSYSNRGLQSKVPSIQRINSGIHTICPGSLFYGLGNLQYIGNIQFSKLYSNSTDFLPTNAEYMFYECPSLKAIPSLPKEYSLPYLTNTRGMFRECSSLTSVPYINTSLCTILDQMFYYCLALRGSVEIDISSLVDPNELNALFCYDVNIEEVKFVSNNMKAPTYLHTFFYQCGKLRKLDLRCIDFTNVTDHGVMFNVLPIDCLIIVANQEQKDWMNTNFPNLTNVQTVAEYEGGNE